MLKQSVIYGAILSICLLLLKLSEIDLHSSIISWSLKQHFFALLFFGMGIWFAVSLRNPKRRLHKKSLKPNLDGRSLLSQRELEVLQGMADGLSNKEIGEHLFLSENTIKTHASNLFSKLEVKRRTQAVHKAREITIIT